jgi:hypothetical protein
LRVQLVARDAEIDVELAALGVVVTPPEMRKRRRA